MGKPVKKDSSAIKKEDMEQSGRKVSSSFDLNLSLHVRQLLQSVKVEKDDFEIERRGETRPKWLDLGDDLILCGDNEGVLSWLRRKRQAHEFLMSNR